MASLIRAAQVLLILVLSLGFYSTWYLAYNNNAVELMKEIRDIEPQILPGTKAPLKKVFTGVGWIDYQLTILTLFFWEAVDGSRPAASLFTFQFGGQCPAVWALLSIESKRFGNEWRIVSLATIWGLAIQMGAFALFMPVYALIHLATSPLVSSRTANNYAVDASVAWCLPTSLVIGFGIPAVLLALPAPSVLTYDQKQSFIAFWQVFPLWVEVLQQVFPFFLEKLSKEKTKSRTSSQDQHHQIMKALRSIYAFVLAVAGLTQTTTVMLSMTSKLFPALFASEFRGLLDPSKVLVPQSFFPSKKMDSIGAGTHQFLQYDELAGSSALLIWCLVLYLSARRANTKFSNWMALKVVSALLVSAALFGPCGSAVCFLWARDELVLGEEKQQNKKAR